MSRMGRRLELVCTLCNEALADLEKACASQLASNVNNKEKEDYNRNKVNDDSVLSENVTMSDTGRLPTPPTNTGGYHPITNETQKDVVATKCGHMFHQGCLRKYVHKTLVEGKGGSLFCPICARPFAMNRLWPVIIPATKSQRERYVQLKMMKQQNGEMVKQLRGIRTKIVDEEERLQQIKEESERCLLDIQQKQKLLDSVNGPTNKEMVELTKLHMKRQEILHVVTQHNADLLKLLAEESNFNPDAAEKLITMKTEDPNDNLPSANSDYKNGFYASYKPSSPKTPPEQPSSIYPQGLMAKKRSSSKKVKVTGSNSKSKKKVKKKKSRRHRRSMLRSGGGSDVTLNEPDDPKRRPLQRQHPSEVMERINPEVDSMMKSFPGVLAPGCRTVDTFMKWNMESVKELMSLESFSECSVKPNLENTSPRTPKAKDKLQHHHHHHHHHSYENGNTVREEFAAIQAVKQDKPSPRKNSANITLARKAPNIPTAKKYLDSLRKK